VIKTFEAQVGQFLLGCKCPVSRFLPGRANYLSAPGIIIIVVIIVIIIYTGRIEVLGQIEDDFVT
jgi:hypothetical protein